MKKHILLSFLLLAVISLQAQWVNDPVNNTLISNATYDAGEIYLSTDPVSGYTYVQWTDGASNGWSPTLQCLNFEGVPQWGPDGIHPSYHQCPTWSQGIAMVATTDNAAVTCFANEAQHCIAIKINADGTYAWGEEGITVFDRNDCTRTELLAGNDGGVWALSTNITQTWLRYIDADGTLHPEITISDNAMNCTFGLMVPSENGVFVVYEKEVWQYTYYYSKELFVAGYTKEGVPFSAPTRLMGPHVIGGSYVHYVVPDGMGGGYAYMWHLGTNDCFNTYVFHFDANGISTIEGEEGVSVHSIDNYNYYLSAYATVDPVSHDLIIVYEQTDVQFQSQCKIYVNRITQYGEKLWDEGYLVLDNGTTPCGGYRVDAFEYGGGFSVIFHKGTNQTGYNSTVEAYGFDMNHNELWNTQMCSATYPKTGDQNSTGYHGGQNITVWVNSQSEGGGGLYGQNIGQNGEMGEVTPPIPPTPCYAPKDFAGQYVYDTETQSFGASFTWTAPEEIPLYYHLYREDLVAAFITQIVIDGEATSFFDETGIGDFDYKLTAVHEDCESDYALTTNGDNHLFIEVTSLPENTDEPIVTLLRVYTMNGQQIRCTNIEELSRGVYIFQGLTQTGQLVNYKTIVK